MEMGSKVCARRCFSKGFKASRRSMIHTGEGSIFAELDRLNFSVVADLEGSDTDVLVGPSFAWPRIEISFFLMDREEVD
jgi:hypothetical protein